MKLTRRQFFLGSLTSIALLGCDSREKRATYLTHGSGTNLLLYNFDTKKIDLIPIGMGAHDVILRPGDFTKQLYSIEKAGKNLSVVDLKRKKMIKSLTLPSFEHFYGHLLFNDSGDRFYSSVINTQENVGYLSLYDSETLSLIKKFQVAPGYLHGLAFMSDRQTIAFASTGMKKDERVEHGSICLFDTKKEIVTKKCFLDNDKQTTAHLCVLPDDTIVSVNTIPRYLRASIKMTANVCSTNFSKNEKLLEVWKLPTVVQSNIVDEFLSLAIIPQDKILAVTSPGSSRVLYFDYENKKLIREEVRLSNGVGVYNKQFVFALDCKNPGAHLLVFQA